VQLVQGNVAHASKTCAGQMHITELEFANP
jgi:hypothetical protein